ncbi:hypothetical protein [Noviherbaspirillum saxi]|uniref:Histone H1-like nucleoprotein HC2 n=1 Tax=Noviherbaspirillum saxi TaxID=2320863 RepID=A0A3A3FRX4_9BURK|nr:hypothetical protein [Noviherbaspirillum saxi]RJF98902.1 hypothetical protein D3871_10545 [Noviherbaspirillum saxi]
MAKKPASPAASTVNPLAAAPVKAKAAALKKAAATAPSVTATIPMASAAPLPKAPVTATPKDDKAGKKNVGKQSSQQATKSAAVKNGKDTKEKVKKAKLVRDSFTMPEAEYAILGEVKKACLKAGIEVKKSELLRVGVALIQKLDTAKLKEILDGLPVLKAGRPKKTKSS